MTATCTPATIPASHQPIIRTLCGQAAWQQSNQASSLLFRRPDQTIIGVLDGELMVDGFSSVTWMVNRVRQRLNELVPHTAPDLGAVAIGYRAFRVRDGQIVTVKNIVVADTNLGAVYTYTGDPDSGEPVVDAIAPLDAPTPGVVAALAAVLTSPAI